jgi:hypothetical protein
MKGSAMIKEWKDLPTAKQYSAGDYVLVSLKINEKETEEYVVRVLQVHDGHYEVLEYSAGEIHGELYMDDNNHRLIGR